MRAPGPSRTLLFDSNNNSALTGWSRMRRKAHSKLPARQRKLSSKKSIAPNRSPQMRTTMRRWANGWPSRIRSLNANAYSCTVLSLHRLQESTPRAAHEQAARIAKMEGDLRTPVCLRIDLQNLTELCKISGDVHTRLREYTNKFALRLAQPFEDRAKHKHKLSKLKDQFGQVSAL